jgi:hypothetical protein
VIGLNDVLEAKLTISKIKTQLLDLAGALIADEITDKDYAIKHLLNTVDYIDVHDITVKAIEDNLTK